MINPLEKYIIVYEVTCLPHILYAQTTKASEPIFFKDNFDIPNELSNLPIECRYSIYNNDGTFIEISSEIMPASGFAIKNSINLTPRKMINKLMESILKHLN